MDLKHLRAFLTVADTGNVTRAAELLHLVQPAVSRQLRLLEEDLGTPLFQREPHGMVLTDAGHALAGYARRVMMELDRARVEIAGTGIGISGLVTLGLLPSTIDTLSSPLVTALASTYPGIHICIAMGYAGTLLRWLVSREIDAALLYGAERSPDVQTTPLIEKPLWVIGSRAPGLRRETQVALASLAGHKLVLPSAPHGLRAVVEYACAVSNVTLDIAPETNALSVQRSLALGGHGFTILPPIAVADDLQSQKLSGALLVDPPVARTIVLALPANRPSGCHMRCAVDLLVGEAKKAVVSGAWPEVQWLGA